jgi:hypothetical protein
MEEMRAKPRHTSVGVEKVEGIGKRRRSHTIKRCKRRPIRLLAFCFFWKRSGGGK